jgi:hypothetical protein
VRIGCDENRRQLAESLRARREEISGTIIARAYAIDSPGQDGDPEYREGLRLAIEAAIDHTIDAATGSEDRLALVPAAILSQARLAARRRVPLETMLRRYLAGHAVLGDFAVEEAERRRLPPGVLRQVLRSQAARTDQVVAKISATYVEETKAARPVSTVRRKAEQVRRLLDGELADTSGLGYELGGWHLALVVQGPAERRGLEVTLRRLDARRLEVEAGPGLIYAWLGTRTRPEPAEVDLVLTDKSTDGLTIGVGEPAPERNGWRLSHLQAKAAISVASKRSQPSARYSDVVLLASTLGDELATTSLRQLYLAPLEATKDGGKTLTDTLKAYYAADRNVAATAAALRVSRNTVSQRLRAVDEKVGPVRNSRAADLIVALQLPPLSM